MSAPFLHGLQSSALLPYIYNNPKLYHELRSAHMFFKDNYEAIYKHFGIQRHEMLTLMCDITKVDVLCGTELLEYVD